MHNCQVSHQHRKEPFSELLLTLVTQISIHPSSISIIWDAISNLVMPSLQFKTVARHYLKLNDIFT
jgi:hypothetical protein